MSSLTPELRLQNGEGTYEPNAELSYVFEIYEDANRIHESAPVPAGQPETVYTVPSDVLKMNNTYGWQAYAIYAGVKGSISDGESFRTPAPATSEGSSAGGPVPCAGSSGPEIIACVGAAFPERLVPTANGDFSDERRYANMEFLRDRIIETGRCKGMDLGLNRKRGTEVISRDFIVLRSHRGKNGRDRGVDIASGYDATRNKLKLTWQVFDDGPNYGHPFYKDYGPVDCSGV